MEHWFYIKLFTVLHMVIINGEQMEPGDNTANRNGYDQRLEISGDGHLQILLLIQLLWFFLN